MLQFTIAPDYLPQHFGAWYLLNNFIQEKSQEVIRMNMPASEKELAETLAQQQEGLAHVSPFTASHLIREHGWIPMLKPAAAYDEIVVVCRNKAPYQSLRDLKPQCTIACAGGDTRLLGMRLMEGFDLNEENTIIRAEDSEEAVLSAVFHGKASVGFVRAQMFDYLSNFGKAQFRSIMRSHIQDIYHLIVAHPASASKIDILKDAFLQLNQTEQGKEILAEFNRPEGFANAEREEVELMLDLLQTLED